MMSKSRTSLFVIGILIAMLAASLLTVLGLYLAGAIAVNPIELEFSVNAVEPKEYDGTPLRARNYAWNSGKLRDGHRLDVKILGEQLNSGSSESDLLIKVYDEEERDVTNKYLIKVNKAVLTVTQKPLTILLRPQQIPYSGSKIAIENYDVYKGINLAGSVESFEKGELIAGHKLVISFPDRFENVGDTFPAIEEWRDENFLIYDTTGNDVTANYLLQEGMLSGGPIEIVPRQLSVKALNVEKYYDGMPVEGKYELVSGTLAAGHFIGGVEFTDTFGQQASVIRAGESATVRVSAVTVYEQVGFDLVPLDEELQKNYILNHSSDLFGTHTVRKRPVTIRAKDLVKTYDGLPLNSILNGVPEYTDDLPESFRISEYSSVAETLTDAYDGIYTITGIKIVTDGSRSDVTDQFEITSLSAKAKIEPVRLYSAVRSYSHEYTGTEISIGADDAIGITLSETIDSFIGENNPVGVFRDRLELLKALYTAERQPFFRAVPDRLVKNAGVYNFTMESTEYANALFVKEGNVIVSFDRARFTVERANLGVEYYYENTAITQINKFYDGTEANLDYRNLLVNDSTNLTVSGADFRYVTNENTSDFRNHALVGNYSVAVSAIRIYDKTTASDVSENYVVAAPLLSVTIRAANLTAAATQPIVNYEVDRIPTANDEQAKLIGDLEEKLHSSIVFYGLAAGDAVSYDSVTGFQFSPYFDSANKRILFYVGFDNASVIFNSKGENVINCYSFSNEGEPVVTVYLSEKNA